MPKLEAVKIDLSDAEAQELEQLLRRTSTPQQIALRAKIILRAATGSSNGKIAEELGISIEMSRRWRQRWRELLDREVPAKRSNDLKMKLDQDILPPSQWNRLRNYMQLPVRRLSNMTAL